MPILSHPRPIYFEPVTTWANQVPICCQSNFNLRSIQRQSKFPPMPILCKPRSIHRQSHVNPVPVLCQFRCQSKANPVPLPITIWCQFSTNPMPNKLKSIPIRFQSCANPMSSNANPVPTFVQQTIARSTVNPIAKMPTKYQSSTNQPIHCQYIANTSQSDANPVPIWRNKNGAKLLPSEPIPIQSDTNPVAIQYQSDASPVPIRSQSCANPSQSITNQSIPHLLANPMSISTNHPTIHPRPNVTTTI